MLCRCYHPPTVNLWWFHCNCSSSMSRTPCLSVSTVFDRTVRKHWVTNTCCSKQAKLQQDLAVHSSTQLQSARFPQPPTGKAGPSAATSPAEVVASTRSTMSKGRLIQGTPTAWPPAAGSPVLRPVDTRAASLSPAAPPPAAVWAATLHTVTRAAPPRCAGTCGGLIEVPHPSSAACSLAMHSPVACDPAAHSPEARSPAAHRPVAHSPAAHRPAEGSALAHSLHGPQPLGAPLQGASPAAAAPQHDVAAADAQVSVTPASPQEEMVAADAVVIVTATLPGEGSGQLPTQLSVQSPPRAADHESSPPIAALQGSLPGDTIGRDDLLTPSSSPPAGLVMSYRQRLPEVLPPLLPSPQLSPLLHLL